MTSHEHRQHWRGNNLLVQHLLNSQKKPQSQNTTQKSISIVFSVSSIRHDSSLSKYRKQKQSPPGNTQNGTRPGGWLLLFTVLAEWRIITNNAYAKNNGDGLLCSILSHSGEENWLLLGLRSECVLTSPDKSHGIVLIFAWSHSVQHGIDGNILYIYIVGCVLHKRKVEQIFVQFIYSGGWEVYVKGW
jgi:hypothetical protein